MIKKILFILLLTIPFIGFGQNNLIIPQPKCEEIDGINFDDVTWTEIDGVNYPNFPKNGVVKMCNENGNVIMEMLYIEGESIRDRYWEDWGMKLRYYTEDKDISDNLRSFLDRCYDKNGNKIECKE